MSLRCLHITLSLHCLQDSSLPNSPALSSVISSPYTSCFSLTGILQFSENSKLFSAPGPLHRSISLSKHSSAMPMPSFISKFEHCLVRQSFHHHLVLGRSLPHIQIFVFSLRTLRAFLLWEIISLFTLFTKQGEKKSGLSYLI